MLLRRALLSEITRSEAAYKLQSSRSCSIVRKGRRRSDSRTISRGLSSDELARVRNAGTRFATRRTNGAAKRRRYRNPCSASAARFEFQIAGPLSRPRPSPVSQLLSLTVPFHHLARLTHKCAIKDPARRKFEGRSSPTDAGRRAALRRIYIIGVTNLQELGGSVVAAARSRFRCSSGTMHASHDP